MFAGIKPGEELNVAFEHSARVAEEDRQRLQVEEAIRKELERVTEKK